jgi:hypothetical protein
MQGNEQLYARNLAAAEGQVSDEASKSLFGDTKRPLARARRILGIFAGSQILALAGMFLVWRLTGELAWSIVGAVASAIVDWWIYGGVFGRSFGNARWGRFALETQHLERMKGTERSTIALSWLSRASRGETFSVDVEDLERLLNVLGRGLPSTKTLPLLLDWKARALKDLGGKPDGRAARRAFSTLRTLGLLAGWIPKARHKEFTDLLLLPLEKENFPDDSGPYAEGLAAWMSSADIGPQDLERAFLLMTQGKAVLARRRSGESGVSPAVEALARRRDLPPSLREALRLHFTAALSESNGFPSARAPFALAKLGFGEQAWQAERRKYDERAFDLSEAYQLIRLAAADPASREKLLRDAAPSGRGAPSGAEVFGPLLSAALQPEPDQDVSRVLTALQKYGVTAENAEEYRPIVEELRRSVRAVMTREVNERQGRWKDSVDEGVARLNSSGR